MHRSSESWGLIRQEFHVKLLHHLTLHVDRRISRSMHPRSPTTPRSIPGIRSAHVYSTVEVLEYPQHFSQVIRSRVHTVPGRSSHGTSDGQTSVDRESQQRSHRLSILSLGVLSFLNLAQVGGYAIPGAAAAKVVSAALYVPASTQPDPIASRCCRRTTFLTTREWRSMMTTQSE